MRIFLPSAAVAALLAIVTPAVAQEPATHPSTLSLTQIGDAMRLHEEKFDNVRLEFTADTPHDGSQPVNTHIARDCTFVRRAADHAFFALHNTWVVTTDPAARTYDPIHSYLQLFDGHARAIITFQSPYGWPLAQTGPKIQRPQHDDFSVIEDALRPGRSTYAILFADPQRYFHIVGEEQRNGLHLIHIEGHAPNGQSKTALWIAPDRDFSLVELHQSHLQGQTWINQIRTLSDFKEIQPGTWFPMHILDHFDDEGDYLFVVKSLSLNDVTDADFKLRVPPGTHIAHATDLEHENPDAPSTTQSVLTRPPALIPYNPPTTSN